MRLLATHSNRAAGATLLVALVAASSQAQYRTIDGYGNNLANPAYGQAGSNLIRKSALVFPNVGADYPDDQSGSTMYTPASNPEPMPSSVPHPRTISNTLFKQDADTPNSYRLSSGVWQWGQFVDHDIGLTLTSPAAGMENMLPEQPDPEGMAMIPFTRSVYDQSTGTAGNPRQQVNSLTSFIDASNVYGSDQVRADALRTFSGGRLKSSAGGKLLPVETDDAALAALDNDDGNTGNTMFVAGDIRANEQTGLTALHTIFMREHNRIADGLTDIGMTDDEEIYQTARKMVGAEMQAITYNEFLPALLGTSAPQSTDYGYDANLNPGLKNEFSTAAFRVGHTMLNSNLLATNPNSGETTQLPLRDVFFTPELIVNDPYLVDEVLMGFTKQAAQKIDARMVDDVRSFLFGFGGLGTDLAALNIQRGRDHGLPSYNAVREAYGLAPATTFDEISTADADTLEAIYQSVDDVDLWVGALAEDHVPGITVGSLIQAVLVDQFTHLRDGDRFFYMSDDEQDFLTQSHIQSLVDVYSVSLDDIIAMNTHMEQGDMPMGFFAVPEPQSVVLLLAMCTQMLLIRPRRRAR